MDKLRLLKSNIDRINNMISDKTLCICPNCNEKIYPKYQNYTIFEADFSRFDGHPARSGLYWCPKCYKGSAGIYWKELK